MAIPIKRLTRTYRVGTDDVELRLLIGEGQVGASVIKRDDTILASGAIAMVRLGQGSALREAKVTVRTLVTDVQRNHNRTRVIYALSGGPAVEEHVAEVEVEREGESALYLATFRFS